MSRAGAPLIPVKRDVRALRAHVNPFRDVVEHREFVGLFLSAVYPAGTLTSNA